MEANECEKNKYQTKQQRRARFALEKVTELCKKNNGKVKKEAAQFIIGVPNMILANGIGQSLAFILATSASNKKSERKHVFDLLRKWLEEEKIVCVAEPEGDPDLSFLQKFSKLSQHEYLKAQEESLRLMEWVKRYARAFMEVDKKKPEDIDNGV